MAKKVKELEQCCSKKIEKRIQKEWVYIPGAKKATRIDPSSHD